MINDEVIKIYKEYENKRKEINEDIDKYTKIKNNELAALITDEEKKIVEEVEKELSEYGDKKFVLTCGIFPFISMIICIIFRECKWKTITGTIILAIVFMIYELKEIRKNYQKHDELIKLLYGEDGINNENN